MAKRFPLTIRRGSITTRVYRMARADGRTVYAASWYVGGVRKLRQFPTAEAAEEEAALQADNLAAGRIEAASSVTAEDAALLAELRRIAGDVPVGAALEEWAQAREIAGPGNIIPAARAWRDAHRGQKQEITVANAVVTFLADKQRAGIDCSASYNKTLPRLKEQLGGQSLSTLSARALSSWIHEAFKVGDAKHAHPVTFNTVRRRLVALWRWARKHGYLARNSQTEAEAVESAREQAAEIGIVTVHDFARVLDLLRRKHPEYVATAALAGFCGLRRSELHAQTWTDIAVDRGFVRVTKAKRNTPSKRLVDLPPAAVEWLGSCDRGEKKLVSPPWGLDRIRAFAREAKIPCPENGFRHAFISHRVASTGNVAETALQAGNSPMIVHKHYRELVAKGDGAAWFALNPERVQMIIEANDDRKVASA